MMEFDTKTTAVPGASTTSSKPSYKAEEGWLCPRCQRINAPWVRQCDCTRGIYDYDKWTITPTWTDSEWWKTYITCTQADADTYINKNKVEIGGSDYRDPTTKEWKNVDINISNNNFDNLKAPKR